MCSLNPDEDRPAMVCELWIDKMGRKLNHRFFRAMIRSKARLTYDEVEADFKGEQKISGLDTLMEDLKNILTSQKENREQKGLL